MVSIVVTRLHQNILIHFSSYATCEMYLCVYVGKGMMPGGGGKQAETSSLLTMAVRIDFLIWKQCKSSWALDRWSLDVSLIPSYVILGKLLHFSEPYLTHL